MGQDLKITILQEY